MQIRITRMRVAVLCLVVVGAAGTFIIDHMIVTEEERVEDVIEQIGLALEAGDFDACVVHFDESCTLMGRPIRNLQALCREALKSYPITDADPYEIDVTLDEATPNRAEAKVTSAVIMKDDKTERKIDWKLEFVRDSANNWKLTSIIPYMHHTRDQIFLTQVEWLLR